MKKLFIFATVLLLAAACNSSKPVVNPPAPTPSDTASNWKTYTNAKYGFEVKYPAAWGVISNTEAGANIGDPANPDTARMSVFVETEDPEAKILDTYGIANSEAYVFQGVEGKKLTGESGVTGKPVNVLVVKKGNLYYEISTPPEIFEQVLAGFMFGPQAVEYKNTQYGFTFSLPASWQGYSIFTQTSGGWSWQAHDVNDSQKIVAKGPALVIRNPNWTVQKPYQDIPVLIFTIQQWSDIQSEKILYSTAAPMLPSELGRNTRYVFALPARYNFADADGIREVDDIIQSHPLKGF